MHNQHHGWLASKSRTDQLSPATRQMKTELGMPHMAGADRPVIAEL